jgi:hypothetical protein
MSPETKLIAKRPLRAERWEAQERGDHNLDRFAEEFRRRLYSDRGREVLLQVQPPPQESSAE